MGDAALAAALRKLGRRDHFRAELALALERKGFEPEDVERAIGRCSELGFLDDAALARRFAEQRSGSRGWGPRRLEAELRRRGADPELAASAARLDEAAARSALEAALQRVERRAPDGWWRLPQARARMVSSLLGRGFPMDQAIAAVEARAAERENQRDAHDDQPGDPSELP